jgi:hypothetical protein
MAFITSGTRFISFTSYDDLVERDGRLLESNEGVTTDQLDDYLIAASSRILTQIRNTDWWRDQCFRLDSTLKNDLRLLPSVNGIYIKSREQEFKDLNIYFALSEYVYPSLADWGNPDSAEVKKIAHYQDQYNKLFKEVIESGDWYDFDLDGTIELTEKQPNIQNRVRMR